MNLRNKKALVTGAALRIGRAICLELARCGCAVVVHCDRSHVQAEHLAGQIRRGGGKACVVRRHLESEADCGLLIDDAWRQFGGLDILVNNASVFHKDGLLASTEAKLLGEFRTNCFVPILLVRAFAQKGLCKGRSAWRGKVVNLLDRRVSGSETGCLPYLLSKTALHAFTRIAALELAPRVTVNAVAPGAILPPSGGRRADVARELAGPVPLRRQCTPSDVAEAVAYLLRSDAATGQTIFVDGGQHLLGRIDTGNTRVRGMKTGG